MKSKVSNDIRGWQQWHCLIRVSVRYSPTMITSLCLAPLCLRYDVTSSYVGTSAISYISLFLHSYMDLLVFLSLLLRRKLLLNPAGQEKKQKKKACVSVYIQTRVYAHLNLQLCNSIYGQFSVLANTSAAPCPIPHIVLCSSVFMKAVFAVGESRTE